MKKSEKGFKDTFLKLPAYLLRDVETEIREQTGWSKVTFYNKRNGLTEVKPLERKALAEIFAGYGIDY